MGGLSEVPSAAAGGSAKGFRGSKPLRAHNGTAATCSNADAMTGRGNKAPLAVVGKARGGSTSSNSGSSHASASSSRVGEQRAPASHQPRPGSARPAPTGAHSASSSRPASAGAPSARRAVKFGDGPSVGRTGAPPRPYSSSRPPLHAGPGPRPGRPTPVPQQREVETSWEAPDRESSDEERSSAAGRIQRWYRRQQAEREDAREAVRKMLAERRRMYVEAEQQAEQVQRRGGVQVAATRAHREDQEARAAAQQHFSRREPGSSSSRSPASKSGRGVGSPAATPPRAPPAPGPHRALYPVSSDDEAGCSADSTPRDPLHYSTPKKSPNGVATTPGGSPDTHHHYSTPKKWAEDGAGEGEGGSPQAAGSPPPEPSMSDSPPSRRAARRAPGGSPDARALVWESCSSAASLARASVSGSLVGAGRDSRRALHDQAAASLDPFEFLEFTREVAARVIQHYARQWIPLAAARRAARVERAGDVLGAFEKEMAAGRGAGKEEEEEKEGVGQGQEEGAAAARGRPASVPPLPPLPPVPEAAAEGSSSPSPSSPLPAPAGDASDEDDSFDGVSLAEALNAPSSSSSRSGRGAGAGWARPQSPGEVALETPRTPPGIPGGASPSPCPSSVASHGTDDSAHPGHGRSVRRSAQGRLSARAGWAAAEEDKDLGASSKSSKSARSGGKLSPVQAEAASAATWREEGQGGRESRSGREGGVGQGHEAGLGDEEEVLAWAEAHLAATAADVAHARAAERATPAPPSPTPTDEEGAAVVPPSPAPTLAASEASSAHTLPIPARLADSLALAGAPPPGLPPPPRGDGPTRGELLQRESCFEQHPAPSASPTGPPAPSSSSRQRRAEAAASSSREAEGEMRDSVRLSAEKLSSILQYLDEVEGQELLPSPAGGRAPPAPTPPPAPPPRSAPERDDASVEGGSQDLDHASSVAGSEGAPPGGGGGGGRAPLAATVYEGVRAKMRAMREQMATQEAHAVALKRALDDSRAQCQELDLQHRAELEAALDAQKNQLDAGLARHLELIDRLLADKDGLAQKCAELTQTLAAAERAAEESRAALRQQFSEELRRHKEAWAASEKVRRETWVAEKTRDIKELTIKGLEPEIQRLMQKHKADMRRAEQRGQEEARRLRETLAAQHEQHAAQLRERLLREREDALEKERLAAAARLREQAERYESQASAQRVRLTGDLEMQVERLEAQRREDKQRHEDALERRRREEAEREDALRADHARDSEEAKRRHQLECQDLRDKLAAESEGWKSALAEKAARELEEKERELRARLARERDEEINVVLRRVEEEASRSRTASEAERREREEALVSRHARILKEVQDSERVYADKYRATAASLDSALERLRTAEAYNDSLSKELAAKGDTMSWLEQQVSGAKGDVAARERDLRATFAERERVLREQADAREALLKDATGRAEMAAGECDALRVRKAEEMAALECRVRATVARKDEAIGQLRRQLEEATGRLRQTESVLERQQAELLS